jgi:hypothetical protein
VNWSSEFVVLNKDLHDRDSFDCGESELNEFIQQRASRHMEIGISTTLVLPASEPLPNGKYPICAFYSVAPGSITKETLPASKKKKLPHYPVPVFLIAQLAVHNECKEKGLGKVTLTNALKYLWDISKNFRAYAVIVDCLNTDIKKFYEQYGFQILCIIDGRTRMFLPMKTVDMLFQ